MRLSPAQVTALRAARDAGANGAPIKGRTRTALQRMFAIVPTPHGNGTYSLTPSGETYLAEHEREIEQAAQRERRLSRPVPSGAFVEPSARTAPVIGHEYEDETPDESTPDWGPIVDAYLAEKLSKIEGAPEITAERVDSVEFAPAAEIVDATPSNVPRAWVDQLVILLEHDARIVKTDRGWRVDQRAGSAADAFLYMWDRLDVTVSEAIRRGIAQALPPTPGQGVVRLALVDKADPGYQCRDARLGKYPCCQACF